jgi:hypothetical protein
MWLKKSRKPNPYNIEKTDFLKKAQHGKIENVAG